MAVDTHELRERLLQSDHEFRDLASRHHELDERLHELASRHFLTEPEQLEEVQIKKQKLSAAPTRTASGLYHKIPVRQEGPRLVGALRMYGLQ